MLAWLKGAWEIAKAIPTAITIAKEIWEAYLKMKDAIERRKKEKEFRDALENGDRKKVEEMLGKK